MFLCTEISRVRSSVDPNPLVAWLSFVSVPAGVYVAAARAGGWFLAHRRRDDFAALALPAGAGR